MPAPWNSWRKLLSCKPQDSELAVHDPKRITGAPRVSKIVSSSTVLHSTRRRSSSSCCSKSSSSLRNVIHGNTRVVHRAESESPSPFENCKDLKVLSRDVIVSSPLPDQSLPQITNRTMHLRKLSGCYDCSIASCEPPDSLFTQTCQPASRNVVSCSYAQALCLKCGANFIKTETLEEHLTTQHTVTELKEGDSARKIVEIIFQTSWLRMDTPCGKPERIFKVHNNSKTVAKFEEYRDMVKAKANKLPKKHSRCLADGNELLRFYSTTFSCSMARTGSTSLCSSSSCEVCQILRFGFSSKAQLGIYTTSSSGKAHDSIPSSKDAEVDTRGEIRVMLVCRVIAGRVKKMHQENSQDTLGTSGGYDSVAGEVGQYTKLEEVLVFDPKAVLPCFVVFYRC